MSKSRTRDYERMIDRAAQLVAAMEAAAAHDDLLADETTRWQTIQQRTGLKRQIAEYFGYLKQATWWRG